MVKLFPAVSHMHSWKPLKGLFGFFELGLFEVFIFISDWL